MNELQKFGGVGLFLSILLMFLSHSLFRLTSMIFTILSLCLLFEREEEWLEY